MKVTHTYDITDDTIQYVVNELNRLEYGGKLTVELVKSNTKLFNYLFRKEVIDDIMDGVIGEAWNSDGFCEIDELIK